MTTHVSEALKHALNLANLTS